MTFYVYLTTTILQGVLCYVTFGAMPTGDDIATIKDLEMVTLAFCVLTFVTWTLGLEDEEQEWN